jgi:predicted ATP-dependent endonuclease of OLD family
LKITRIRAKNFLSFDSEGIDISNFANVNSFVGPNNSGKTNFFRIVTFIGQTLRSSYNPFFLNEFLPYYHDQNPDEPFEIEVSLELTHDERKALVDSLICAQLTEQVNNLPIYPPNTPLPYIDPLRRFVLDFFGPMFFGSLFGEDFSIVLTGTKSEIYAPRMRFRMRPGIHQEVYVRDFGFFTTAQETPRGYETINPAQRIITDIVQKHPEFGEYLKGITSEQPAVPTDYSPPTLVDFLFEPRDPARVTPRGFQTQRLAGNQLEPNFTSSGAFQRLRAFYRSRGSAFSTSKIGFFDTIRLIFLSSILVVSDARGLTRKSYLEDLESEEFPLHDLSYEKLPQVLHRFKNSEFISERKRLAAISKLFSDLSDGLTFDIVIRTSTRKINEGPEFVVFPKAQEGIPSLASADENFFLGIRSVAQDRKIHELSIEIRRDSLAYPLELSAAGIAETLLLATSIGSTTGSVIFLDEPAQKMHPNLQRKFLDALLQSSSVNNNQFFVITHSPYLVRAEEINNIWRFDLKHGISSRVENVGATVQRLEADDRAKIQLSLRNADIRALLFSRGVVLVEGPSDKIVLEKLDESLAKSGKSADLSSKEWSVVEVGGKSSFPTFFKLCKVLGIPMVAVADYDALMQLDKRTSAAEGKLSQTSPILLALYLTQELTSEETLLVNENGPNVLLSENGTKWYDPSCLEIFLKIARSNRIFVFTKDLEGALQTHLTKKDMKPLKALDEISVRIQDGKFSDELNNLGGFLKQYAV